MPMTPQPDFDVAIVGAGPVGLACAGWLAQRWEGQANRIAVFDAKPLEATAQDPRVLALSEATRLRLAPLGFPDQATPIHHIHVSEQHRFAQVRMKAEDMHLPALGWTVRYGEITHALSAQLPNLGVQVFRPVEIQSQASQTSEGFETLQLGDGRQFTTRLRIDAEGGLYGSVAQRDRQVDFNQWALVAEVQANVESRLLSRCNTLAFERFTAHGPLALLPTSTNQQHYALVWCASPETVKRRLALSDAAFVAELNAQLGRRVQVQSVQARQSFPVGMAWRDQLVQGRRVVVGNAAQILHPVAGQGLNLGLRDALQLCRRLLPETVNTPAALHQALSDYQQSRTIDRMAVLKTTQWMVNGFSTSNPMLTWGRQWALNMMEYTPMLRNQFAGLMLFGLMV
jgi:2-octaprenyl-6-methoxyphenol hydroxylase